MVKRGREWEETGVERKEEGRGGKKGEEGGRWKDGVREFEGRWEGSKGRREEREVLVVVMCRARREGRRVGG